MHKHEDQCRVQPSPCQHQRIAINELRPYIEVLCQHSAIFVNSRTDTALRAFSLRKENGIMNLHLIHSSARSQSHV